MIVVLIGILLNNARLGDVNHRIGELRSYVDTRFNEVDRRLNEMDRKADQRLDDVKATWRAELHRVEEVLDARLKHLEER
jgi:hypothetical protein